MSELPDTGPVGVVLGKLQKVKKSGLGWIAACPAHEDRVPSLKIDKGKNGEALVHCHAGCETTAIVEALGLTMADLFVRNEPPPSTNGTGKAETRGKSETKYPVKEIDGTLVAYHVRQDSPSGKRFLWQQPNGEWRLPAGTKSSDLPLYGIDEVGGADSVVVTEGEKARDALKGRGVVAVGTVTGASSAPGEVPLRHLVGKTVLLWPDNDAAGEGHMGAVAAGLLKVGEPIEKIRRVRWEGAPKGGDAADVHAHHRLPIDEATPWFAASDQPAPRRTRWSATDLLAADLPEPRWAVPDLIPEGLTVLAGRPKKGKSRLALGISVARARGTPALGHFDVDGGADVLFVGLEDGPIRLQERIGDILGKSPAPPTLDVWFEIAKLGEGCAEELEQWLRGHPNAGLIVLDTYQRLRKPPTGREGNAYAVDYQDAAALQSLGIRYRVAILLIHHTRKPVGGGDPFDDVLGSTGNTAAADALMVLVTERGRADAKLLVVGRDLEEAEHALSTDPVTGAWTRIGDAADVRRSGQRSAILAAIRAVAPDGLRPRDIAQATKQRSGNVRYLLFRMRNDGEVVERDGHYFSKEHATSANTANVDDAQTRKRANGFGDSDVSAVSGVRRDSDVSGDRTVSGKVPPDPWEVGYDIRVCDCGTFVRIGAKCHVCGKWGDGDP